MKTLTKLTLAVTMLLASVSLCSAQGWNYHRGYTNQYGTYVQPHWQTNPDGYRYNNWSTYPNVNPINGRQGTIRTMPLIPNPFTGR